MTREEHDRLDAATLAAVLKLVDMQEHPGSYGTPHRESHSTAVLALLEARRQYSIGYRS